MKLYIIRFEKRVITTRHDMPTYSLDCGDPNISWIEQKLMSNLKAMGPDKINGKVLKNCSIPLSMPLSILFKKCYIE